MQNTLILLFLIAILVIIIVGLVAYRLGFQKGFISTSAAFNQLLDSSLQRRFWEIEHSNPTDTDEQKD